MTSQEHFQELGATASCTMRMGLLHQKAKTSGADEPKVCGMKGDAWFGSVKTCSSLLGYGIESIFQVKTAHKDYPKKFIDEKLKNMPGGVHLVLEGIHEITEEKLIAIGYRYNSKKTLFFVMSPGAGSTRPGTPYEMKFPTEHENVGVRMVDRPDAISKFFMHSNVIDKHNQARQFELHLEKCWVTLDPYFRLHTTILGMNVADCWKVCNYHGLFNGRKVNYYSNDEQLMPIRKFSGLLSFQLLSFADCLKKNSDSSLPITILMQDDSPGLVSSPTSSGQRQQSLRTTSSGISSHTDSNGVVHFPVAFSPSKGARCGIKPRRCAFCRTEGKANSGGWARHSCNVCNKAYCCPSARNNYRDCFRDHVEAIKRTTRRRLQVV